MSGCGLCMHIHCTNSESCSYICNVASNYSTCISIYVAYRDYSMYDRSIYIVRVCNTYVCPVMVASLSWADQGPAEGRQLNTVEVIG